MASPRTVRCFTQADDIVIGMYADGTFTSAGASINAKTGNSLGDVVTNCTRMKGKAGDVVVLPGISIGDHGTVRVAVVGLGPSSSSSSNIKNSTLRDQYNDADEFESQFTMRHNVREAVKKAVRQLKSLGSTAIQIENFGGDYSQEAAEGAYLGNYKFKVKKPPVFEEEGPNQIDDESEATEQQQQSQKKSTVLQPMSLISEWREQEKNAWTDGRLLARSQNYARWLADLPANYLTPESFCEIVQGLFAGVPGVTVNVHGPEWVEQQNMGAFISVAKGSQIPLRFLEIIYSPENHQASSNSELELAFVGKGVTFDTGGINIKLGSDMGMMRGDMGGAAAVVSAFHTLLAINANNSASQSLPRMGVFVPLCENMPSHRATKPADVVTAMNGKTIEIDNTDAEGRLILADALYYAVSKYSPKYLMDVATLTGAIDVALGDAATGVFTNSSQFWKTIELAGILSGDKMWRMPLFPEYKERLKTHLADIKNSGGRSGGSCTAAIFLQEFIDSKKSDGSVFVPRWAHFDIAAVSSNKKVMTGRPTRALVKVAQLLLQNQQAKKTNN